MNLKIVASDIPIAIPPGETILAELEARGQSLQDLTNCIGLAPGQVQAVVSGDSEVTPELASLLAEFFGTSVAIWTNLEQQYQAALHAKKIVGANGKIALRLPKSLHERVIDLAEAEGVSMNHCLLSIVAEGVARYELRRSR